MHALGPAELFLILVGIISIYCAVGKKSADVAKVIAELRDHGVMGSCIVVVATGEDTPGLQFIAPYAATSMGEYFVEQGRDVLIIYDDLTSHARAYREVSLLLRRPPGREAFPGDILYPLTFVGAFHAYASGIGRRIVDLLAHYRNRSARHVVLYSDQSDFHNRRADLSFTGSFQQRHSSGGGCR